MSSVPFFLLRREKVSENLFRFLSYSRTCELKRRKRNLETRGTFGIKHAVRKCSISSGNIIPTVSFSSPIKAARDGYAEWFQPKLSTRDCPLSPPPALATTPPVSKSPNSDRHHRTRRLALLRALPRLHYRALFIPNKRNRSRRSQSALNAHRKWSSLEELLRRSIPEGMHLRWIESL